MHSNTIMKLASCMAIPNCKPLWKTTIHCQHIAHFIPVVQKAWETCIHEYFGHRQNFSRLLNLKDLLWYGSDGVMAFVIKLGRISSFIWKGFFICWRKHCFHIYLKSIFISYSSLKDTGTIVLNDMEWNQND